MNVVLIDTVRTIALGVLLLGAMWGDLKYRMVPNYLTIGAQSLGLVLAAVEGTEFILRSLLLSITVTLPFLYGFQRGWMGGGDVKLVAATSLLAGHGEAGKLVFAGILCGGLWSLLVILRCRRQQAGSSFSVGRKIMTGETPIPYAAAFAVGAALCLIGQIAF